MGQRNPAMYSFASGRGGRRDLIATIVLSNPGLREYVLSSGAVINGTALLSVSRWTEDASRFVPDTTAVISDGTVTIDKVSDELVAGRAKIGGRRVDVSLIGAFSVKTCR
jgi:hypothetical protein